MLFFLLISFSRRATASTMSLHPSSSVWKMESTQMEEVSLSLSGYRPTQRTLVPRGRRVWAVRVNHGCNESVLEPLNHQLLPETWKGQLLSALITMWQHDKHWHLLKYVTGESAPPAFFYQQQRKQGVTVYFQKLLLFQNQGEMDVTMWHRMLPKGFWASLVWNVNIAQIAQRPEGDRSFVRLW